MDDFEIKMLALGIDAVLYVGIMFYIQEKYLKLIKNGKLKEISFAVRKKIKKLRLHAIALMTVVPIIHLGAYIVFLSMANGAESIFRFGYLILIVFIWIVFILALSFNFLLRGGSTLPKQKGQVSGVP